MILPFIGHKKLYDKFNLVEPWSSPQNLKLLGELPEVYQSANQTPEDIAKGLTVFQVPYFDIDDYRLAVTDHEAKLKLTRMKTLFHSSETGPKIGMTDCRDGISNTIMILEVNSDKAVPWTVPSDWRFDPKNPKRDLCEIHRGGFVAALADTSALFIEEDIAVKTLADLMTRSSGDGLDLKYLKERTTGKQ